MNKEYASASVPFRPLVMGLLSNKPITRDVCRKFNFTTRFDYLSQT